eukprot:g6925.t1
MGLLDELNNLNGQLEQAEATQMRRLGRNPIVMRQVLESAAQQSMPVATALRYTHVCRVCGDPGCSRHAPPTPLDGAKRRQLRSQFTQILCDVETQTNIKLTDTICTNPHHVDEIEKLRDTMVATDGELQRARAELAKTREWRKDAERKLRMLTASTAQIEQLQERLAAETSAKEELKQELEQAHEEIDGAQSVLEAAQKVMLLQTSHSRDSDAAVHTRDAESAPAAQHADAAAAREGIRGAAGGSRGAAGGSRGDIGGWTRSSLERTKAELERALAEALSASTRAPEADSGASDHNPGITSALAEAQRLALRFAANADFSKVVDALVKAGEDVQMDPTPCAMSRMIGMDMAGLRPMPLGATVTMIAQIYDARWLAELHKGSQARKRGGPVLELPKFCETFLLQRFGVRTMARESLCNLQTSVQEFMDSNLRCWQFAVLAGIAPLDREPEEDEHYDVAQTPFYLRLLADITGWHGKGLIKQNFASHGLSALVGVKKAQRVVRETFTCPGLQAEVVQGIDDLADGNPTLPDGGAQADLDLVLKLAMSKYPDEIEWCDTDLRHCAARVIVRVWRLFLDMKKTKKINSERRRAALSAALVEVYARMDLAGDGGTAYASFGIEVRALDASLTDDELAMIFLQFDRLSRAQQAVSVSDPVELTASAFVDALLYHGFDQRPDGSWHVVVEYLDGDKRQPNERRKRSIVHNAWNMPLTMWTRRMSVKKPHGLSRQGTGIKRSQSAKKDVGRMAVDLADPGSKAEEVEARQLGKPMRKSVNASGEGSDQQ